LSYYVARLGGHLAGLPGNMFYNMFTYLTTEIAPTTPGAVALADAIVSDYLGSGSPLLDIIHEDFTFTEVYVWSPPVPTALGIATPSEPGLATGDRAPNFVAFEFKSPRTLRTIREGKKRFSPVSEGMITDGELNPTFASQMDSVADMLNLSLIATVSGEMVDFVPIIVKRVSYETPGGSIAYRYPEGLDPFVYSDARNWVYQRVTSQNSRKR